MSYYIDAEKVSLKALRIRIEETDLIPSQIILLKDIKNNFKKLKINNIFTLADLRKELKNAKNISSFSQKTGIDAKYLTLLRRLIEGYFPKKVPLKSFDWLSQKELLKLVDNGFKNTVLLFEALNSSKKRKDISNTLKISVKFIDTIFSLISLMRIQWVSPLTARMLISAGYDNAKIISKAVPEELCNKLDQVNKENNFFKGKLGLRDIKRLVKAASYVP